MIVRALQCDWDGCNWLTVEGKAAPDGWLSVGGGRRGRSRTDLCPTHARSVIAQVTMNMSKATKRKGRR